TPLGNTVYGTFTLGRPVFAVPPHMRALNDVRVGRPLQQTAQSPLNTQDAVTNFYRQTKYDDWSSPIRLASGLEARYIVAEAQLKAGNSVPALALIAERSVEGDPDAVFIPSGDTLTDLLDLKVSDFYIEGVHMGDLRRNPN